MNNEPDAYNTMTMYFKEMTIEGNTIFPGLQDVSGFTALMGSIRRDNTEIAKLLFEADCDVDRQTICGNTALMLASDHDNIEIVKLLLGANCDVNIQNNRGITALMYATQGPTTVSTSRVGNTEIVKLLLEASCDANIQDNTGRTALMYASVLASYDRWSLTDSKNNTEIELLLINYTSKTIHL